MPNSPLLDEELTHERLFADCYSWLQQWALRLTEGRHTDAEDLVHDLYIQLMRLRPRIHPDADRARGYLYTMLRNMHVSRIRRAERHVVCELTAIDYDSFEQSMRAIQEESRPTASAQLWRICEYMCERKKSSRAASALILRFFLGYFPSEIARIFCISRSLVDKHLHTARQEARSVVARSQSSLFRARKNDQSFLPDDSQELFLLLRGRVFRSCEGSCLPRTRLAFFASPLITDPLNTVELAHLVSCAECLDKLNRILGIRLLAERCPSRVLGRDSGPPRGGTTCGSSPFEQIRSTVKRRLEEENEHRPEWLHIAVDGEIRRSHRIDDVFNEMHFSLARDHAPEFIEILSEQDVRLLYLPCNGATDPYDGGEHAVVELSDGRILDASVLPRNGELSISLKYIDPLFEVWQKLRDGKEDAWRTRIQRWNPAGNLREKLSFLFGIRSALASRWMWVGLAGVAAMLLAGVLLRQDIPTLMGPSQFLEQVSRESAAAVPRDKYVKRTIMVQQIGDSGTATRRDIVVEWTSPNAQQRARRLYSEEGHLVAEEITNGNNTQFYGKAADKAAANIDPSTLQPQDVWQISPSAKQFAALIAPAKPSSMEQQGDHYSVRYVHTEGDMRAGLVEATLIVRRKDLHPVEEDLVLRSQGTLHRVHLIEADYEDCPPERMLPNIFVPDKELIEDHSDRPSHDHISAHGAVYETSPERTIHALYLLSRVGADMNGETSVQVLPDGILRIRGEVDSPSRKDEILQALNSLRGQRRISIRLLSPQPLRNSDSGKRVSHTVELIQPAAGTIPLDTQVRQILGERGTPPKQMDRDVEHFSQKILILADDAKAHAWALHLIATRFTPMQLNGLTPGARSEWAEMINAHASAVVRSVQSIHAQIATLAPPHQNAPNDLSTLNDVTQLVRTTKEILALSQSCDRDLAAAFSLSESPIDNGILTETGFWRSLSLLESFANQTVASNRALARSLNHPELTNLSQNLASPLHNR